MLRRNCFYRFQLNNHLLLNKKIGKKFANTLLSENHFYWMLGLNPQPFLFQGNAHGLPVNRFKES